MAGCATTAITTFATFAVALFIASASAQLQNSLSDCVGYVNPTGPGMFPPTGTWSIAAFVKDPLCLPIHVAGMRGITPANNTQVDLIQPNGTYLAVREAFQNMLYNAAQLGASPYDCSEVLVFVRNMPAIRPIVNQVQTELWGDFSLTTPVHPPRTIIGEVTFNGANREAAGNQYYNANNAPPGVTTQLIGDILEVKGTFYVQQDTLRATLRSKYGVRRRGKNGH